MPTNRWEQQLTMNQQQQNHRLRTDSSLRHQGGWEWGLKCIYWCQILALDSVVVKIQNSLGFRINTEKQPDQINIL